ncbi:MAG: pknB [Phycisphaerales bacterium]|nr:pknB [Phycisphaerales bacterium]
MSESTQQPDLQTRGVGETVEPLPISRPAEHPLPEFIGVFRVLEIIGEGGMGVVYKAEQREPVRRVVALKVIKLGMDTKEVVARFEAERQALAMLSHPNVAKVFEAGMTEQGRPYFAMEHVPGVPLTEYCDKNKLSTDERLELIIPVCQAVQHAHQKGIIHRDLKPSNILVTMVDGKPVPKVIDFGIAKATSRQLTARTLFTHAGAMIGTPEYMSPEQAMTSGLDVDTRTDIYSLGVILYELLTGTLPFAPDELRKAGMEGMARIIQNTDPHKPSVRLTTLSRTPRPEGDTEEIARRHRTDTRTLQRELRGDLDWIVLKAMEKDRTRRYETANALALDIRRHLDDEPVLACPPSTIYRLTKLVRKHKVAVAGAAAVALALVAGLAGTSYGLIRARQERDYARDQQRIAGEQRLAAEGAKLAAERAKDDVNRANVFMRDLFMSFGEAPVDTKRRLDETVRQMDEGWLATQPDTATACRIIIAYSYLRSGALSESEQQFRAALNTSHGTDGQPYPQVAGVVYEGIGAIDLYRKDKAAAERDYGASLAAYRRFPRSDPHVASILTHLAEVRADLGDASGARAARLESLTATIAGVSSRIAASPGDAGLLFERGVFYMRAGKFREARDDMDKAVALDPSDHFHWYYLACLRLNLGDEPGYRSAAQTMLERFSDSTRREVADRIAKTCLLSPVPVGGIEQLNQLADRSIANDAASPLLPWFRMCKGMAEYRAGRYASSREWLAKAHVIGEGHSPVTLDMLSAMAQFHLGETDAARAAFRRAADQMDKQLIKPGADDLSGDAIDCVVAQIIRREGEALLGLNTPATHPAP